MRITLGACVWTNDCNGRTEVFDEVPSGSCDSEEVVVVLNVAQDFKSGVMLEEEVHFDTDAADVLEHVGELHVIRVRAEAVKSSETLATAHRVKIFETHIS